jgi:hypothetical protein
VTPGQGAPVLDIFAGAGGLSLGLERAGFTVAAGAEWDRDACATYAAAHPRASVLAGDVAAMSFRCWRGQVEVLAGGPPCQPWSTGGKRLGAGDPRNGWPAFIRALREIRPRAFLAENVAGLAAASRRAHLRALLGDLAALGFGVSWAIVNAADYGVPQPALLAGLDDPGAASPGLAGPGSGSGAATLLDWQKLLVTSRALRLRREYPAWFAGDYDPLPADGPAAEHAVAFARGGHAVTVATRLPATLRHRGGWSGTVLALPGPAAGPGAWRDVLTGTVHAGPRPALAQLTEHLPVALLVPA